ncbi:hypothetical protein MHJ85_07425 [Brevibacterium ravenspurgense]|uniref:hypothetical protein n=1 Tax=Brevibacterium ravenspurgense TaxID=479117 RepID=UPI001EF2C1E0|nr:hypothetical protein [Brevibacterium ravenspurgense]MCG7301084.1 hypothetical protein [Brevibacterium ravenspurgense]
MTAGQWQPPRRSAAVAPLGGDSLAAHAATAVHEELDSAGFAAIEALLPDVAGVGPLCDAFADSADLLVLIGGLSADDSMDVAGALSQFTDTPLPGLQAIIFDSARRHGANHVLFTAPWVGWVGTTLAIALPADEAVAASVMSEILPLYADVLDQRDNGTVPGGPSGGFGSRGGSRGSSRGWGGPQRGQSQDKGADNDQPGGASILQMPRPVTPDDEGDA